MPKQIRNLETLNKIDFKAFFNSFDTVLTDCDGVLWLEMQVFEGAPDVINLMREMGKKIFYVTNNSTKPREDFEKKAKTLGYKCTLSEVLSSAYIAANYLKSKDVQKAYVIGSTGITQELDKVGIEHDGIGPDVLDYGLDKLIEKFDYDPNVGAVVVGFDPHISYVKLFKAASYLKNPDCLFVATNTDESFPAKHMVIPGTGTFVEAVATCSGRRPTIMGKPHKAIVETIQKDYKLNPQRTLMIGDRCNTDILLGSNCGFQTLLVLTGVNSLEDAKTFKKNNQEGLVPDYYLHKLADLLPLLKDI